MLAVILYHEDDRRLRPLTDTMPLAMLPLHQASLLERQLCWLGQNGVTHAAIVTPDHDTRPPLRLPREIAGVRVTTALAGEIDGYLGAVRRGVDALTLLGVHVSGEILAVCGSVYCEADIRDFLRDKMRRHGRMGVLTFHVKDPSGYCMLQTEARDALGIRRTVTGVCDCPAPQQCCDDTVDAGIALLSPSILRRAAAEVGDRPEWNAYTYPAFLEALLRMGDAPLAWEGNGYWCNIRDISAYYRCCMRLLARERPSAAHGENIIGHNCAIYPTAQVTRSILMDGAEVGEGSSVDGAILCPGAVIGSYTIVRSGCVIGAGSAIGDRVSLAHNIRIRAGDRIHRDVTLLKNNPFARQRLEIGEDASIGFRTNDALLLLRLGAAAVRAASAYMGFGTENAQEPTTIGVTASEEAMCTLAAQALLCGITAAGGQAIHCGSGYYTMAADHARRLHCAMMLMVEKRDGLRISLLDQNGLMLDMERSRQLTAYLARDPEYVSGDRLLRQKEDSEAIEAYRDALTACAGELYGLRVRCDHTAPGSMLAAALRKAGAEIVEGEERAPLIFSFDEAGTAVNLTARSDGDPPVTADLWHIVALLLRDEALRGTPRAAIPYRAPECLSEVAKTAGIVLTRYRNRQNAMEEEEIRRLAGATPWFHDPVFAAARLCGLLSREKTNLRSMLSVLPYFYSSTVRFAAVPQSRAALLRSLGKPSIEGVRISYERKGSVRVIPDAAQGFFLIADAVNAETAGELLDLSRRKIMQLLDGEEKSEHKNFEEAT